MAKKDKESDLLRTAEVAAHPLDPANHETVPIDLGTHHPPAHRPSRRPDPKAMTVRVPGVPLPNNDDTLVVEDTSGDASARSTEKALSIATHVTQDRATLTVLTGINAGQIIALDAGEHIVGRGTEASLWLEDPAVSREHARITREPDGRFLICDLDSTNGTFVSGRRIEKMAELQNGDRIQVGPTQMLRFSITDDAEEELQRRLYESSTRDGLTRAFNRKYLNERLPAEIAHARRHKTELALLMLDLDRFKEVNDAYGHLAGDMLLRVVASHLLRLIRLEDVLARYGGEEFVSLLPDTDLAGAIGVAQLMEDTVRALALPHPGVEGWVTISLGVSAGVQGAGLLEAADRALYLAKAAGRGRVSWVEG